MGDDNYFNENLPYLDEVSHITIGGKAAFGDLTALAKVIAEQAKTGSGKIRIVGYEFPIKTAKDAAACISSAARLGKPLHLWSSSNKNIPMSSRT